MFVLHLIVLKKIIIVLTLQPTQHITIIIITFTTVLMWTNNAPTIYKK